MSDFKFFRDIKTGRKMRALAYPFMGQNSRFVAITEEEYHASDDEPVEVTKKFEPKRKKPKAAPPKSETPEPAAEAALPDNDDLTAGLDYGEDGR